jgi:ABC-2 type transport system permease protein
VLSWLPQDMLLDPRAYRATAWTLAYSFFFKAEVFFIMLLAAIAGPGLISQDLRFNALPLYFARPLTRLDYFLGKLGIIGALVASIAVGPAVVAYVVGLAFCLDLSVIKDTYPILLASVAYGLVITLSAGTLILALSSLTRRSLYVGITWAGFWIISSMVGGILTEIHRNSLRNEIRMTEMDHWLDQHPPPQGTRINRMGNYQSPIMHRNPKTGRYQLDGLRPEQEQEGERWFQGWSRAQAQVWETAQTQSAEAMRGDWRPICSYTTNLERMADLLLDTDGAWVAFGKAVERPRGSLKKSLKAVMGSDARLPPSYERRYADRMVLQYPWWWSAGVLAGLLGLSTWTLTRRVKSLDRLR